MKTRNVRSAEAEIQIVELGDGTASMLAATCPSQYRYNPYSSGYTSLAAGDPALGKVSVSYAQMNLRGFNGSRIKDVETGRWDLPDYMSDFDHALKKLNANQQVLFGYSHGGYFTTQYAISRPKKVKGLILVEPALFTSEAELERRAKLAESGDGVGAIEKMLQYVHRANGRNTGAIKSKAHFIMSHIQHPRVLAMEFRTRARNPIIPSQLEALEMPVLLIGGTESQVKGMIEKAAGLIPNVSCWWVRGADHLNIMEHQYANEISSMVNLFISRL